MYKLDEFHDYDFSKYKGKQPNKKNSGKPCRLRGWKNYIRNCIRDYKPRKH